MAKKGRFTGGKSAKGGPGVVKLAKRWRVRLPAKFSAYHDEEFDDDVFQKKGITLRYWIAPVEAAGRDRALLQLLALMQDYCIPGTFDASVEQQAWGWRFNYFADENRLVGPKQRRVIYCFYGFAISKREYVHFQGYADAREDLKLAVRAWNTLEPIQSAALRG